MFLLACRTDTDAEVAVIQKLSKEAGAFDAIACSHWEDGGEFKIVILWHNISFIWFWDNFLLVILIEEIIMWLSCDYRVILGSGALDLAKAVENASKEKVDFSFLYDVKV